MCGERHFSVVVSTSAWHAVRQGSIHGPGIIRCKKLALNIRDCVSLMLKVSHGSSVVRGPLRNFGKFVYPTLPVFFRRDTKSRWPFLPGVYARGSKNPTQGVNV